MVIARGTMQIGRVSILRTAVTLFVWTGILSSSQTSAPCGSIISFTVRATYFNIGGSTTNPIGGPVYIVDLLTNPDRDITQAIASGTLVNGSFSATATFNSVVPLTNPVYSFVAVVPEVVNRSSLGYSDNPISDGSDGAPKVFSLTPINSSIIIEPVYPDDTTNVFCYNYPFTVKAHIKDANNNNITSGDVEFNLFSDSGTSITPLTTVSCDGYGIATTVIPAAASSSPQTMFLRAKYLGSTCFNASVTSDVASSSILTSIQNNPTTTVLTNPGSSTFNRKSNHSFAINITPTGSVHLSKSLLEVGTIQLRTFKNSVGSEYDSGPATTPMAGLATIVIPGNSFPSAGAYTLDGYYITDGNCYASSVSSHLSLTLTEVVVTASDTLDPAIAGDIDNTYTFTVSSVTNAGNITGLLTVTEPIDEFSTGPIVVNGPYNGATVNFTIPANALTAGSRTLTFTFIGDSNSNGYGDSITTDTVNVII